MASDTALGQEDRSTVATLLLPTQWPSFECAYLAVVMKKAASDISIASAAAGCTRFRIASLPEVASGAACLLVGTPSATDTPCGHDRDVEEWRGRSYVSIPEMLAIGHEVINGGCGSCFTCNDARFDLSERIRAAADNPAVLGPLIATLSRELRVLVSNFSGPLPLFFGGSAPSLGSDVPLVGALLTSRSWCRRVAESSLENMRALEWPLKGLELVLYWMLCVLEEHAGHQALQACRGEMDVNSFNVGVVLKPPHEVSKLLATLKPPDIAVRVAELLTDKQREEISKRQADVERANVPLLKAVRSGDLGGVRSALELRADVGVRVKTKHHEYGLEHIAASLGVSAPIGAIEEGHAAELIAKDLDIRLFPPGSGSVETLSADMLKVLVACRASLNSMDSDGSTPLFYAAMSGNTLCLDFLLHEGGLNLFAHQDLIRRTALYWAASNDQKGAVAWLLENASAAIPIDAQSKHGRTALAKAAWGDLPEVASMLLDFRADPRVRDDHGRNVLHMASWGPWGGRRGGKYVNGRAAGASPRCVEILLRSPQGEACMAMCDRDDATPLHVAASTGALDVLNVMLSSDVGRRIIEVPLEYSTDFLPLAGAAFRGHDECLRTLLLARADANYRNASGRSALDFAVAGRERTNVVVLIDHIIAHDVLEKDHIAALFASAAEWAVRIKDESSLQLLTEACPHLTEGCDLICLCLLDTSKTELAATIPSWPPFPKQALPMPKVLHSEDAALLLPWGPLPSLESSSSDILSAKRCCALLLHARASVFENVLCTVLRLGILKCDDRRLLDTLISSHSASLSAELLSDKSALNWPLVAAANAADESSVKMLLAYRASPVARDALAIAVAAAAGSCACLTPLLEAAAMEGHHTIQCSLSVSADDKQPLAVIAACHGHAACVAHILRATEGYYDQADAIDLRARCITAAAKHGHYDVARWLEENMSGNDDLLPSKRCSAPTVLRFRTVVINERRASRPCDSSSSTADIACSPCEHSSLILSWEKLSTCSAGIVLQANACMSRATCTWVDTLSEASKAVERLRDDMTKTSMPVIGVDVECFEDVICTVQISSMYQDVIFDGLRLHSDLEHVLQELLLDATVIKIFHAPKNDLQWLFSNFNLQVRNLFDTATAAREILLAPHRSGLSADYSPGLKALCREHLNYELDKTFQRSDWRLRPLPQEMLLYAATDSRVLIPLALRFANLLATAGRLEACYEACQRFDRDGIDCKRRGKLRVELL
eukprot:TRINITY_DN39861_c0_g1_i1.p1 TRINITY_DN39861_c0_g1~~TRINITY_DN39861_c0_g1_i1.p1  ORF type:complete len:1241 (-),score=115.08 TRINITY_DN39861_c0_g1_i1:536-4258(-)